MVFDWGGNALVPQGRRFAFHMVGRHNTAVVPCFVACLGDLDTSQI